MAALDANAIIHDDGAMVRGVINFGIEDFVFSCQPTGQSCSMNWTWHNHIGTGELVWSDSALTGTWSYTGEDIPGGPISLKLLSRVP
jgi:hypothetical protein